MKMGSPRLMVRLAHHERVPGPFVLSRSKGEPVIYRAGAKRLRNLKSCAHKSFWLALQLDHSQLRQDHVPKRFRPLAALGVKFLGDSLAR